MFENIDYPKYISFGDFEFVLLGWEYVNNSFVSSAKYVGFDGKQTSTLLVNKDFWFHCKWYVDFMLRIEDVICEHLHKSNAVSFLEKAKGQLATKFRADAKIDALKENKFYGWTI